MADRSYDQALLDVIRLIPGQIKAIRRIIVNDTIDLDDRRSQRLEDIARRERAAVVVDKLYVTHSVRKRLTTLEHGGPRHIHALMRIRVQCELEARQLQNQDGTFKGEGCNWSDAVIVIDEYVTWLLTPRDEH